MDALWKHYGIPMASPNEVRLKGCYNLALTLCVFTPNKPFGEELYNKISYP